MTIKQVKLHENIEFFRIIENEFRETPIFQSLERNINCLEDKHYLLYLRRWLHTKAHEYGKHVHYEQRAGKWGAFVFTNDDEYIMFKLTHV
jgi:hypothetical protein